MSFPQLGYPQYLSAAGPGAYGGERPGVLAAAAAAAAAASSGRPGAAELGAGAGAAAVTSVLGMYAAAGPYAGAPNYSAFLPYAADLSLFSQMVSAPGPLSRAALRRRDPDARAEGAGARAGRERGPVRLGGGGGERREAGPVTARPAGLGKPGDGRPGPPGGGGPGGSREAHGAGPGPADRAEGRDKLVPDAPDSVAAAGQAGPVYPAAPSRAAGPAERPFQLWGRARRLDFLPLGQNSSGCIPSTRGNLLKK